MSKKERRRERSRSRSLSPRSKALARAQITQAEKEEDGIGIDEKKGHHHKLRVDQQKLEESRKEYANLRASLMTFKEDKMGTNLDENNISVQEKFSALQLQRQKFLNSMRNTKARENETMAKFNNFMSKLKTSTKKTPIEDDD